MPVYLQTNLQIYNLSRYVFNGFYYTKNFKINMKGMY